MAVKIDQDQVYEEMIRLLDDLSDERNWTERVVGMGCTDDSAYEYYTTRDDPPWIDARKAKEAFERYVEAVTKVRRTK